VLAANCRGLEELSIYSLYRATGEGVFALLRASENLRVLSLTHVRYIYDYHELFIGALPASLEQLDISGCRFPEEMVRNLVRSCPFLRGLNLSNTSLGNIGLAYIADYGFHIAVRDTHTLTLFPPNESGYLSLFFLGYIAIGHFDLSEYY